MSTMTTEERRIVSLATEALDPHRNQTEEDMLASNVGPLIGSLVDIIYRLDTRLAKSLERQATMEAKMKAAAKELYVGWS